MRFFKNLTIKFKLFLTYSIVSLVVFSLSFALLFFQIRKNLEYRIKEELSKSNQTITDMVETTATISIKNHLRAIAEKNKEIIDHLYQEYQKNRMTESEAKKQAIQILLSQTVGETGYIYCVNSKGIAVVHPREGVLGNDFSDRRFVQAQIKKKAGYLEYDWGNPGELKMRPKALYMSYFKPWDWIISVSSYKSEFTKLISIDDFKDRIIGLTFGGTGYSFIFDTSGHIVIHPELSGDILNIQDKNGRTIVQQMIQRETGFMTYNWKNPSENEPREKFVAFDSIPIFNWIIASSSYTREVFSPLFEMQKIFILILIIALLIIAVVTLIVSASITKPLTAFILRFEKGVQGDLSSRMDDSRKDEIGKLSSSFNLFMTRLETYQHKLVSEISVRKDTEKELSHLRNYLVNIIDSMPSALIGVNINGNVTQWNKKAEELTGLSMVGARGKLLSEVFPRIASFMNNIQESMQANEIQHVINSPYGSKAGETRYDDITIYPLTADGVEGAVILIDDVTEKFRMEEALIQNEKMLSVGGLAAGMAHEINNPLAGVIQNANVLANRLTDKSIPANLKAAETAGTTMESIHRFLDDRKIPRMIKAIIDSGVRMADIVDNMLSFARKSDSSFSVHNPVDLMNKSLELAATDYNLKKHYDFKSITIEKKYEDNLPMIACEQSKIRQVLFNILNNGAHFMFEGRQKEDIRKSKFILRISHDSTAEMLQMEIEDNGAGMDKKISKRIFEPFFTTKPVGIGIGLGLSLSYFIITENHGGTMAVTSEPGKGTNFIIRLPLEKR